MAGMIPRVGCNLFIKTVTYLYRYDVRLFMLFKIVLLLLISNMRVYLHLHVADGSFLILFSFFVLDYVLLYDLDGDCVLSDFAEQDTDPCLRCTGCPMRDDVSKRSAGTT